MNPDFCEALRCEIIRPALARMGEKFASREAEDLLLGTGAAESGYRCFRQRGGGPARGFWQIEPTTALDLVNRYLRMPARKSLLHKLDAGLWAEWQDGHFVGGAQRLDVLARLDETTLVRLITEDLGLQVVLARLRYFWSPEPLPRQPSQLGPQSSLAYWDALGRYWRRVYNTEHGAGSAAHWMRAVTACGLV